MAAGAYKGLTIKLGADTSKLSSALREASSAAYKTQTELNKLSKAAKIDPGNINVAARQMTELSAQAVNAAAKMSVLASGVHQLANTPLKTMAGDVAQLAKNTDSAALAANRAKSAYDNATKSLAKVYRELASKSGDKTFRNFDGETTKDAISKELGSMVEKGKLSDAEAKQYLATIEKLKGEWNQARDALDDYENVAKLDTMTNDLAAQEAEIVKLSRSLAEMDHYASPMFSELSQNLDPVNSRLVLLEAAADTASDRFKSLSDSLQLDPTNMELASDRANAMGEAMLTAEARATALRERMAEYESMGIDKTASQFDSVALEVEKSEMAFMKAKESLDRLKLSGVDSGAQFERLSAAVKSAQERMDTAHACQQYENLKAQLYEVNGELSTMGRELVDIHAPSDVAKGFADLQTRLTEINASISNVSSNASSLDEILKLNPDNTLAASAAMEQLQEQERLATEKAQILNEQLSSYDLSAIEKATDSSVSATTQLLNASDAAKKANDELLKCQATLANVETEMERLSAKKDWDGADTKRFAELSQQKANLMQDFAKLKNEADAANKYLDLSKGRAEVQQTNVELAKIDGVLDKTFVSMQKLSKSKLVPEIDTDKINKSIKDIEANLKSLTDGSAGKKSILGDLKPTYDSLNAAMKSAETRSEALKKALKLDPSNVKLASKYAESLSESQILSTQKTLLLSRALAKIPADKLNKAKEGGTGIGVALEQSSQKAKLAADKVKEVARNLEDAKKRSKDLKEIDLKTHPEKVEALTKEIEELQAELEEAKRDADAAFDEFKTDSAIASLRGFIDEIDISKQKTSEFGKQAKKVLEDPSAAVSNAGGKVQASMDGWKTAAVQAAQAIGSVIEHAASKIVDAGVTIDSSYRDLRKTFQGSEDDYKDLYDAAMKYSQAHVTSADKMLEMESIAAQVGVGLEGGADAVQHFAETVANLDVATNIDAEDMALQLGQVVNIMDDLDESEVDKFADSLVRLGNNMPAQESAIMDVAQRMASQANIIGLSTPQVLGWSAAIASTGQHSEAAATAMGRTMALIEAAVAGGTDQFTKFEQEAGFSAEALRDLWNTDQNAAIEKVGELISSNSEALEYFGQLTGQTAEEFQFAYEDKADEASLALVAAIGEAEDKLELFASVAGDTADEFAQKWTDNPSEALQDFINGLARVDESGQSVEMVLKDLGITGVRQKQGLESLTKTVDILGGSLEMSQDAWNGVSDKYGEAGDAAREAERKSEGLSGSMEKMKNSADILAASLGEGMVPFIDAFAGAFQGLTAILNSSPKGLKSAVVGIGALAGAVGVAVPVIFEFQEGWGKIIGHMKETGAIEKIASGFGGLKTALVGLATPLGVVVAAIGAIAAIVGFEYIKRMQEAKKYTDDFNEACDNIKGVTDDLARDIYTAGDAVEDYAEKWSAARVDMEKYHESLKEHTDAQNEAREAMVSTVGELDRYQEIIGRAIGKGEKYAGNIGELQWAIDGLNDLTGESWTIQDILTGKYESETGALKDTKDAIYDLIEARKREAQISGYEKILSENIAAQQKNEVERRKAANAYQNWIDMKLESSARYANPATKDMTDTQYIKYLQETDEHTQELLLDSKNLRYEQQLLAEQYDETSEALGGMVEAGSYATTMYMGERESVIRMSDDLAQAAKDVGITGDEFVIFAKTLAQRMQDCGISTSQFAKVDMAQLGQAMRDTGGDVQGVLDWLLQYEDIQLDPKYAEIYIDENGDFRSKVNDLRVEWDYATENWKPIELDADTTMLEHDAEQAKRAVEGGDPAKVTVEGNTDKVTDDVAKAKAEAESSPAEVPVRGNTDSMKEDVVEGTKEATEAASEEATVTTTVEMDASNANTSDVSELLGLDGKTINLAVNITANTDGANEVIDSLNGLPKEPVNVAINVSAPNIGTHATNVKKLNDAAKSMDGAKAKYTAEGNAAEGDAGKNVKSLNEAVSKMKSNDGTKSTISAAGNAASGTAASNVWSLVRAIDSLPSRKETTIVTSRVNRTTNITSNKTEGPHAAGVYINPSRMPKHAAGIFTRPTLTNIGWVGEDGAELYSGNSLVPLTNRKYSMPYINDISDAVAKKMGRGRGDNYITLNVSCDGDPNDNARAIVRALESLDL